MQRICELPPVIMAPLHNQVYSLDVWTLWSTVLQAPSLEDLHYAGTGAVPVADTDQEALSESAVSPISWRPSAKHNSLVMITHGLLQITLRNLKSEAARESK